MAQRRRPPHVIENFLMEPPASDPMSPDDTVSLAESAILSGAAPTNASITTILASFRASLYVRGLSSNQAFYRPAVAQ